MPYPPRPRSGGLVSTEKLLHIVASQDVGNTGIGSMHNIMRGTPGSPDVMEKAADGLGIGQVIGPKVNIGLQLICNGATAGDGFVRAWYPHLAFHAEWVLKLPPASSSSSYPLNTDYIEIEDFVAHAHFGTLANRSWAFGPGIGYLTEAAGMKGFAMGFYSDESQPTIGTPACPPYQCIVWDSVNGFLYRKVVTTGGGSPLFTGTGAVVPPWKTNDHLSFRFRFGHRDGVAFVEWVMQNTVVATIAGTHLTGPIATAISRAGAAAESWRPLYAVGRNNATEQPIAEFGEYNGLTVRRVFSNPLS